MKIAHVSHSTSIDGAAIAARRLHDEMCLSGMDSSSVTAEQLSRYPNNASWFMRRLFWMKCHCYRWWIRFLYRKNGVLGSWSDGYSPNSLKRNTKIQNADVIYLHWICDGMVSIEELGRLLDTEKQIVWFLHDMWPMTGGCHYSYDCSRYEGHCGSCPRLDSANDKDLSWSVFERKIRHLTNRRNLTIISPSNWLAKCAQKSRLFKENRIIVIPNILNTELFHPISKMVAREALGLPYDKKILLFGCINGSAHPRKCWTYLNDVLSKLANIDMEIVMFGGMENAADFQGIRHKMHCLGRLHDEMTLALAYSAADVFVSPSIAENFSLMLCEASACGTPTVCFDVGGNGDIVKHCETGYLAKYKDSEDLARGIEYVLGRGTGNELGANAREHVIRLCSPSFVIPKHQALINELFSA